MRDGVRPNVVCTLPLDLALCVRANPKDAWRRHEKKAEPLQTQTQQVQGAGEIVWLQAGGRGAALGSPISLIMAPNLAPPAPIRGAVRKRRLRPVDVLRTGLSFEFARGERERQRHLVPSPLLRRRWRPADRAEFQVFAGAQGGRDAAPHPPTAVLPAQRCHHPHRAPCAARAASSCTQDTKKPGAARLHHLKLPLCRKDVPACVEINQCDGCTRQFFTKSFLGDEAAVRARSSGEEPASSRHRAGGRVDGVEDDAAIQQNAT